MHAASTESPRLKRVHAMLKGGEWLSTRDILYYANVCAVNSCIAELRANGIKIATRCVGQGRYEYRLEEL